jgi:hypothetical protein
MSEKPILFSSDMVKAILEKRKTQTRRIIKPQPSTSEYQLSTMIDTTDRQARKYRGWNQWVVMDDDITIKKSDNRYFKPAYQVGDKLWVREKWRVSSWFEGEPVRFEYSDGERCDENEYGQDSLNYEDWLERICLQSGEDYEKAGIKPNNSGNYITTEGNPCRWRSAIHMPKWAARIWLEVTAVRAERLQDISEGDAKAEGVFKEFEMNVANFVHDKKTNESYKFGFKHLWDSLNAKRGYGWDKNPWVFIYEFKVCSLKK